MRLKNKNQNDGFVLISLLLAIVIIAVLFAIYYGGSGSNSASMQKTGQKAIEQAKQNNAAEIQNHLEIQNELNSIDK